jgi:hypothetical protein
MSDKRVATVDDGIHQIERVLVQGDLSSLTPPQRVEYLEKICTSLGLNLYTRPFQYIMLSGRLTLYATRDATDQLRKLHGVSIRITARERQDDIYIVTAEATDRTGRGDSSIGAVTVAGLKGEALANAFMKAETKSKRRATLSLCGLGFLDETEVETVPNTTTVEQPALPSGDDRQLTAKQLEQWAKRAVKHFQVEAVEQIARDLTGVWNISTMTIGQARMVMEAMEGGLLARDGHGRYIVSEPVWDDDEATEGA